MLRTLVLLTTAVLLTWGLGCGDDAPASGTDAGTDAGADASAGDAGPLYVPVWDCLGAVTVGTPPAATADVAMTVTDFAASTPLAGAAASACAWADVDCATPIDMVTTDAAGLGTVTVPTMPTPFWGYALFAAGGFRNHEVFASMPVVTDSPLGAALVTDGALSLIVLSIGETQDWTTKGVVAVFAQDCNEQLSSGVRLTLTSGTGTPFYAAGGAFSTTATETDVAATWGIVNAGPGELVITAVRASDSAPIATARIRAKVGVITGLYLLPTPGGAEYVP